MHIIMLYVDGIAQPFGLRFKDEEKARGIYDGIITTPANNATGQANEIDVTDDYGQRVAVRRSLIKVPHFMPVVGDLEAQGDVQILSARENARLQTKAKNDQVLQLHQGNAQASGQLIRPS